MAITVTGSLVPVIILIIGLLVSLNIVTGQSQKVATDNLYLNIKTNVQYETQIMVTSTEALYNANKGKMPEQELEKLVLDNIRNSKYGDSGYYFVYDETGIRLVAPENKAQEGQNLIATVDKNGVKPVVEFIKLGKQGGGSLTYEWLNPKTNKQEEKIAYVSPLKLGDLELVIGTGTYMPMIESTQVEIGNTINTTKNLIILILVPLCIIFSFLILVFSYLYYSKKIIKPIKSLTGIADKLAVGDVDVSIDKASDDEIGALLNSFDKMAKNIKGQALVAEKIALGDVDVSITAQSDKDVLTISLLGVINSLKDLSSETDRLIIAAGEGNFALRGNSGKFKGQYASMIIGENQLLDEVVKAFDEVHKASNISKKQSEYLDLETERLAKNLSRLSSGNIELDLDISEGNEYTGKEYEMFRDIRSNLEKVQQALKSLIADAGMLTQAAVEGKLSTRADAAKHEGDYRKIVDGMNNTLDAVIDPLNIAADYVDKISNGNIPAKITDTYNGDFNSIKNNLNTCIDAVNSLVEDTDMLGVAAAEGRLSTRADATKHYGDFRKIVEGVNKTLDYVINPLNEVSEVMKEMSEGKLQVSVKGDYKGDFAELKDSVNLLDHNLTNVVNEISSCCEKIASGNIDIDRMREFGGDYKSISVSINTIIDSLNEVLLSINTSADQVSAGSNQVSGSSQALSQGATEQASSIEELSASIKEIASQTMANSTKAIQANELAVKAKNDAVTGSDQMKLMLQSMSDINEASANISKVIKVIDDIAFQTNILALNAAVEAARAGQYGKGFAVVAEEVRNLAAKSANAASETTTMIEGSMKKAEAGTKIASGTAEALVKIVEGVDKAAVLVAEIAAASNEQATGVAQINMGVEQVSQVVQTNSATAEESAAASEELSSQAEMLKEMVGRFSLRKSQSAAIAAKTERPSAVQAAPASNKRKTTLNNNGFGEY